MSSSPPKRRRIAVQDDDDDDEDGTGTNDTRAERLARLAEQRRRARQEQEESQERSNSAQDDEIRFDGEDDEYRDVDDIANNNNEDVDSEQDDDVDAAIMAEEEDGEDLLENAEKDYQAIPELDTYGAEGMDDRDYGQMNVDDRRAAERELSRRDNRDGFYGLLDTGDDDEDEEARQARRGQFRRQQDEEEDDGGDETEEEDLDGEDPINLEAFDVPLREWIAQDRTRREIQRKFRSFLRHFNTTTEDSMTRRAGNGLYEGKIRTMCANNLSSLHVSYLHLCQAEPVLAMWLTDAPKDMLLVLNEAATRHTLSLFPKYNAISSEIFVRIAEVPILDSLRDLRTSHLNCLVKVHGVVTRRSAVYPQLCTAYYTCCSCKQVQGPIRIDNNDNGDAAAAHMPDTCPTESCQGQAIQFRLDAQLSQYRNVQRINLQETPGSVPPGRVPRSKQVTLSDGDLMDVARPGEQVEVTGVLEHSFDAGLTLKSGFPVFTTQILANHVTKRAGDNAESALSEADIAQILELSKDPQIAKRIVKSLAPSIFGHDNCKLALAMALFGGVPKNVNDKHRVRGDVNVLLLGDPGTAKSQLLKYAEHTAPRAVYSTGKGASAVGLTAAVQKDPITKEWTLEGGALVLADQGVCLIDEFDKMNEQDRTSIHEAMEQQSISVSKAGIVTSLQARCSVIAAANPIGGRYDSSSTLADNVEMTDPILQRFDVLCVLQDVVDPIADERLAQFVTASHMRAVPTRELQQQQVTPEPPENPDPDVIPQDLLCKYIQYARQTCSPQIRSGSSLDQEKVASLYVALRRESQASGGVPIAVRHIESIMRMSEAHAKMHLRSSVRDDDLNAAISLLLQSFIVAQKFSVRRALKRKFAKYLTTGQDVHHLLLHILQELFRKEQMYQVLRQRQRGGDFDEQRLQVEVSELQAKARERRIYNLTDFFQSPAFAEAGYVLDERRRVISRNAIQ